MSARTAPSLLRAMNLSRALSGATEEVPSVVEGVRRARDSSPGRELEGLGIDLGVELGRRGDLHVLAGDRPARRKLDAVHGLPVAVEEVLHVVLASREPVGPADDRA